MAAGAIMPEMATGYLWASGVLEVVATINPAVTAAAMEAAGTIIGAIAGGLLGNGIAGRGDRTLGTISWRRRRRTRGAGDRPQPLLMIQALRS